MEKRIIKSKAPRADILDKSYFEGNILGIEKEQSIEYRIENLIYIKVFLH